MKLKELYHASPFGMVSSLFYGTIQSALFTLLAVYATSMNFTILEISIVTFLLAVSGAIAQFPIGKISDMYDRRKVIVFSTFVAEMFSIFAILVSIIHPLIPKDLMVESKEVNIKRGKIIGSIIGTIIGLFMGYYLWVNGYFDFFLN